MKHGNKIIALLLTIAMLLSITGCGLSDYVIDDVPTESSSLLSSSIVTEDNSTEGSDASTDQSLPTDTTSGTQAETDPPATTEKPSGSAIVGSGIAKAVDPSSLPAYSGTAYTIVNDNQPNFSSAELTTQGYEKYCSLDSLGRCGVALASCGKEIMPGANEERGSISSIKPSGWIQAKYDGISGGYLWNRCHLLGWQLSAENANVKNLISGTRYLNACLLYTSPSPRD